MKHKDVFLVAAAIIASFILAWFIIVKLDVEPPDGYTKIIRLCHDAADKYVEYDVNISAAAVVNIGGGGAYASANVPLVLWNDEALTIDIKCLVDVGRNGSSEISEFVVNGKDLTHLIGDEER